MQKENTGGKEVEKEVDRGRQRISKRTQHETEERRDHREATSNKSKRRKRRHLCAAPALLPVLLLQLCVLHSQLEAGQLGHERLVTHMERIRDGELEREQRHRKGVMTGGDLEMRRKKRRRGK